MELKSLIDTLNGKNTKTASAPAQPVTQSTAIDERMREVVAHASRVQKQAADGDTLQDALAKEAQAFADAGDEAFVRRCKLGGAAFADTVISRFDAAGAAAESTIKEAAAGLDPEVIEMAKLARDNPGRFLADVHAGYDAARSQKVASYQQQVHGWATDHYLTGYASVQNALWG